MSTSSPLDSQHTPSIQEGHIISGEPTAAKPEEAAKGERRLTLPDGTSRDVEKLKFECGSSGIQAEVQVVAGKVVEQASEPAAQANMQAKTVTRSRLQNWPRLQRFVTIVKLLFSSPIGRFNSLVFQKETSISLFKKGELDEIRTRGTKEQEWQETFTDKPLKDMLTMHPQALKDDFGRGSGLKINESDLSREASDKGEKDKWLSDVGKALSNGLRKEPGCEKLTPQQIEQLRYQIEDIALKGDFSTVDEARFIGKYASQHPPLNPSGLYRHELPKGKHLNNAEVVIKDNKVVITSIVYKKIINPESGETLGYDALKYEAVIDLSKLRPDKLLATAGCSTLKVMDHGFRERIEDISFATTPAKAQELRQGCVIRADFEAVVSLVDKDLGKSMMEEWEQHRQRPLSEMRGHPSWADLGRLDLHINHEQVSTAAAKTKDKTADVISEKLTAPLRREFEGRDVSEEDLQLLRFQIEGITGQWMDQITAQEDAEYQRKYPSPLKVDTLTSDELRGTGKRTGYDVVIENGKVIITSPKYYKILHPEWQVVEGYEASLTRIEIDLTKLKPGKMLATPGCAQITKNWHGARRHLAEIDRQAIEPYASKKDPLFHGQKTEPKLFDCIKARGGKKGDVPSPVEIWTREKDRLARITDVKKLREVGISHPRRFENDCDRAVYKIDGSVVFTGDTLEPKAKKEKLGEVGKILSEHLSQVLQDDVVEGRERFSQQERELLRYQIEDMANQWIFTLNDKANTAYEHNALKGGEKSFGTPSERDLGKPPLGYEITVVPGGLVMITGVEYRMLMNAGKVPPLEGYDAHRVQIVIDLNKVKPGEPLLSADCATVTDSWHGLRRSLADISW